MRVQVAIVGYEADGHWGELMTRQRRDLTPSKCYVGQRVYWVMWCDGLVDESGRQTGWFCYKHGLCPEIWSGIVDRLARNAIMLVGYGKTYECYSNQIEAINAAYEKFVLSELMHDWRMGFNLTSLGEASRVLRLLAELEYGLHCATDMASRMKA